MALQQRKARLFARVIDDGRGCRRAAQRRRHPGPPPTLTSRSRRVVGPGWVRSPRARHFRARRAGRQKFASPTTYRRSGVGVPTPVWIARDGDALVVTTPAGERQGQAAARRPAGGDAPLQPERLGSTRRGARGRGGRGLPELTP